MEKQPPPNNVLRMQIVPVLAENCFTFEKYYDHIMSLIIPRAFGKIIAVSDHGNPKENYSYINKVAFQNNSS